MLYGAEGSKHRNAVIFTNSDADIHRHFVRFLRQCYQVAPERILISVNCHLVYGTAKITVHSTFIVQSIYGAIQEYVGVDRPAWLDCTPPRRDVAHHPMAEPA
jgi:hypothetical protein